MKQAETAETTQKLPIFYLKYFLLKISSSQIGFVLICLPYCALWQIWSQKLKLSELSEILYMHTLYILISNLVLIFSKLL